MNNKIVSTIIQWLCVTLVIISVVTLFTGGLTVADKDIRKSMKKEMKSALKQLDAAEDELKDAQEELDDFGIEINAKKLFNQVKSFVEVFQDATLSPFEVAKSGPRIISLINELEENSKLSRLIGFIDNDVMDVLEDSTGGLIFGVILFYLTVLAGIITVILHALNKRPAGISFTVLMLAWLITIGVAVSKMNNYGYDELYLDDKILTVTASPVWGFILALLAMLLWVFKDLIAKLIGGVAPVTAAYSSSAPAANVCPSCGKVLREGAIFCTGCGAKFTPPTPANAPVAPTPAAPAPAPAPAPAADDGMKVCHSCGARIPADSDFCTQCGTKLS